MWRALGEEERGRRNGEYGVEMDGWRRMKAELLLEREREGKGEENDIGRRGGVGGGGVNGRNAEGGVGKKTEKIMRMIREERRGREEALVLAGSGEGERQEAQRKVKVEVKVEQAVQDGTVGGNV
jgi:hypothetical protein